GGLRRCRGETSAGRRVSLPMDRPNASPIQQVRLSTSRSRAGRWPRGPFPSVSRDFATGREAAWTARKTAALTKERPGLGVASRVFGKPRTDDRRRERKVSMPRLPRMFRSIGNRNYRLYFFGQGFSLLGSWLQSVAQAWLVYRLTSSSFQLGLVAFIGQAPLLFLSPIGGLIADRYPRRRVVVATQTCSMLLAFVLAALTLRGEVQLWQILLLAGLQGIVYALDVPARQALVAAIVEADDLLNAVALNSSAFSNASSVAPVIAGFLVAAIGEGWCFAINGLTY